MIEFESIERDGHTHLLFTLGNVTVEMSEREVLALVDNLENWLEGEFCDPDRSGDPGAYSRVRG